MMSRRSIDEIKFLVIGIIMLWGGGTLLNEARHAGPQGQVTLRTESDGSYTISSRSATAQGVVLLVPGIGLTLYGLSRMCRLGGRQSAWTREAMAGGTTLSWPLLIGMLLFVAILAGFWNFLFKAMQ